MDENKIEETGRIMRCKECGGKLYSHHLTLYCEECGKLYRLTKETRKMTEEEEKEAIEIFKQEAWESSLEYHLLMRGR